MADETKFQNGWPEKKSEVYYRIEAIEKHIASMDDKLDGLRSKFDTSSAKNGAWGAVGAMIPIAILLIVQYMSRR